MGGIRRVPPKALLGAKIDAMVASDGYAVVSVMAGPGEADALPFCYTVGLTAMGLPELAVAGLPWSVGPQSLGCAVEVVRRLGRPSDGTESDLVFAGFKAVLRRMPASGRSRLVACVARYGDFDAMVVVYPDRRHRMPWDGGCDAATLSAASFFGALPALEALESA